MSASHFGTKYWLDDYFGPYFQPEGSGGAIIGALSGTFAGNASFSGTLVNGAEQELGGTLRGRRRWPRRSRPIYVEDRQELEEIQALVAKAMETPAVAYGSGEPLTLARSIERRIESLPVPQPFDYDGAARMTELIALSNEIEAILQDIEEEELLLLVA